MPQIVAAALAKTAVAAPVAATIAPTAAGIGTAAANTAALELAKQQAIQAGMKQVGTQAVKQVGTEAAKQSAVEASKQGIAKGFQNMLPQAADDAASLAVQSGSDAARNQAIEAFKSAAANPNRGIELGKYAGDVTSVPTGPLPPAGSSYTLPGSTPIPSYATPTAPLPPAGTSPVVAPAGPIPGQSSALPPEIMNMPSAPTPTPVDAAARESLRRSAERGFQEYTARESMFDPLRQGIAKGVELVKKYPMESGMAAMSLGQYMNQPEKEDKGKYKNKVDMSEFKPSLPSVGEFKPSYEYQKYAAEGGLMGYAVGGPIEEMSAMNSVGANTQYPMAGLATPLYSNPSIQRPEAINVISPSGGPVVGAYSGEQKFAEGGISEEMAREYGLKNRKQRAAKSLTKDYEEMESQRTKEANELLSERSGSGIIPRSRTQQLSSPFSAAIEEHNRLAKKTKTPKFETPKTSLGDIDTYMDIPVEAAGGGIMGSLGSYSDGGRLLRGPGDGVSDSIPAVIGKRQPARLADGEFVIPARIVSELGNGSTEAGARKLYAMMDRIQNTRKKSIGKKKVAVNSRADKHLPA
jgi:hypothetical protein